MTSKDHSSVLTKMFSERTGFWDVTPERVAVLRLLSTSGLPRRRHLDEMVKAADSGKVLWEITAERMAAIYSAISSSGDSLKNSRINVIIRDIISGAASAGLQESPWVKNVLSFLQEELDEKL